MTWQSSQLRLPKDHGWQSRDGFSIVVADRGALRFDVPSDWRVCPGENCDLQVTDKPPPDDDVRLEVTLLRGPTMPGAPSLVELLRQVATPGPEVTDLEDPVLETSARSELAWTSWRWVEDGRQAIARTVLSRGPGLHALLTLSLWADDQARCEPAWHELRRSLAVGVAVDISGRDPRRN